MKNLCNSIKVTRDLAEWEKTFANWRCDISLAVPLTTAQGTSEYDLGTQLQVAGS